MNMHPGGAALEQIGENLHMNLGIGTYRPTLRHLFERNLRFGALLNGFRIANIEEGLPCLGAQPPESRRFFQFVFPPQYNDLLKKDGHWSRILAGIGCSL